MHPTASEQPTLPSVAARSWGGRWLDFRNRLLSSPSFQRRAAAFTLTRPLAHKRARELFDLVAGFVYSQILLACVRLRLFDILAEGPLPLRSLSQRLEIPEAATERLLAAAASLRLVERVGAECYGLGVLGAPMAHNPALSALVEHHSVLYADLADPLKLLRGEPAPAHLSSFWPYASATAPTDLAAAAVAPYSDLMSKSQPLVGSEVLDAYPLAGHRCLLDVGGGEGEFLVQVAARAPHLRLMLFDLPAVAQRAQVRLQAQGLASRTTVTGGDFLLAPLPEGADVATLVRVIHDHDDMRAMTILRAVRKALGPGGTLLLAEPMAGTAGAEPMGDAYFGFYLLAMGRGKPRTSAALSAMLIQAGFVNPRLLTNALPLQTRVLMATTDGTSRSQG